MLSTLRILSLSKSSSIFSQMNDSFYSFDFYKYYIIIGILFLISVSFFIFIPNTFAESSLNSSSSIMINSRPRYLKNLYSLQSTEIQKGLQYFYKVLSINITDADIIRNKKLCSKLVKAVNN